jgi:hypothetical protein
VNVTFSVGKLGSPHPTAQYHIPEERRFQSTRKSISLKGVKRLVFIMEILSVHCKVSPDVLMLFEVRASKVRQQQAQWRP